MRIALLLLIAAMAVIGVGYAFDRGPHPAQAAEAQPGYGPPSFDAAVGQADANVSGKRVMLRTDPDSWLRKEILALTLADRFRLTTQPEDLAESARLLDEGLALVPDPAGPAVTRAHIALVGHDLDRAGQALDRFDRTVVKTAPERAAAEDLRGDIYFQRGDMSRAKALYREANAPRPMLSARLRLANALMWSGDPAGGSALGEKAIAGSHMTPQAYASTALILANLSYAQGDLDTAGEWIERANRAFSGNWLGEAYAAQQRALTGDVPGAIAAYRAIAKRTDRPEVMDALAHILRLSGNGPESREWEARSAKLWQARMLAMPDAFRLHAAEHELALGDPAKALTMLRQEAKARPQGPALSLLARAQRMTGDAAGALKTLERAKKTGWESTSLALERSQALAMLGRQEEADRVLATATKRNPAAADPNYAYLWFGHD